MALDINENTDLQFSESEQYLLGTFGLLREIRLRLIDDSSFKNQRTNDFKAAPAKEDKSGKGNSFAELTASIRSVGLKDPITVRIKPPGSPRPEIPLECIKGFRRLAVVTELAIKVTHDTDPKIQCIIKKLSDLNALEENIFENTARDNLSGPDLAWAAFNLRESYRGANLPHSGNVVAAKMAKNQSYIAKLLRIIDQMPEIAALWQKQPVEFALSVDAIERIRKLANAAERRIEFERRTGAAKADKAAGQASGPGGVKPLATAQKQVRAIAEQLGKLQQYRILKVDPALNWAANLEKLRVNISGLSGVEVLQLGQLASDVFSQFSTPTPGPNVTVTVTHVPTHQNGRNGKPAILTEGEPNELPARATEQPKEVTAEVAPVETQAEAPAEAQAETPVEVKPEVVTEKTVQQIRPGQMPSGFQKHDKKQQARGSRH